MGMTDDDINDRMLEKAPFEASDMGETYQPQLSVQRVPVQATPAKKKKKVIKKVRPITAVAGPIQMQIAKAMLKNMGDTKRTKPVLKKEVPASPTKRIKAGPSIDAIVGSAKKVKKNKDMPRQITTSPQAAMAKKKKIKISKIEILTTIQPIESSVYGSINDHDKAL